MTPRIIRLQYYRKALEGQALEGRAHEEEYKVTRRSVAAAEGEAERLRAGIGTNMGAIQTKKTRTGRTRMYQNVQICKANACHEPISVAGAMGGGAIWRYESELACEESRATPCVSAPPHIQPSPGQLGRTGCKGPVH